jgi:hypothetical protein
VAFYPFNRPTGSIDLLTQTGCEVRNLPDSPRPPKGAVFPERQTTREMHMDIAKLTVDALAVLALIGFTVLVGLTMGLFFWLWHKAGKEPGEL